MRWSAWLPRGGGASTSKAPPSISATPSSCPKTASLPGSPALPGRPARQGVRSRRPPPCSQRLADEGTRRDHGSSAGPQNPPAPRQDRSGAFGPGPHLPPLSCLPPLRPREGSPSPAPAWGPHDNAGFSAHGPAVAAPALTTAFRMRDPTENSAFRPQHRPVPFHVRSGPLSCTTGGVGRGWGGNRLASAGVQLTVSGLAGRSAASWASRSRPRVAPRSSLGALGMAHSADLLARGAGSKAARRLPDGRVTPTRQLHGPTRSLWLSQVDTPL
jgi:hypothetical protein